VIGAVVFVIFFVLFLIMALAGISLPPGDFIIQEYIPDITQTDYAALAEGIINGVIYGFIIWLIFSIVKIFYDRMQGPKEVVVKVEVGAAPPPSAGIEGIEGIGPANSKKLRAAGVKTTDDLLAAGGTKAGRKELSDKTGISETVLLGWVNKADLFRVKGIGEEYSDLLKETGVSTVVELGRRNPEKLHEAMAGVNKEKKLVRRTPTLAQTTEWVEQAKTLPRKVEY
jgi:predicted flap endonuclease-1-like 5' DNA nuclease